MARYTDLGPPFLTADHAGLNLASGRGRVGRGGVGEVQWVPYLTLVWGLG